MSHGSTPIHIGIYRNAPEAMDNCPRFPEYSRSTTCPYPGWCLEVVSMVAQYLHLTVIPVIFDDEEGSVDWGSRGENGTFSGALGAILDGTVNTVCLMYQMTPSRVNYFKFVPALVSARPVFIVKTPTLGFWGTVFKVFRTFQAQLWLSFFVVVAVQVSAMVLVHRIEDAVLQRQAFKPGKVVWDQFRFFIVQGHGRSYRRRTYGGNLLMTICAIVTLLVTSLYQGLLLTQLLNPIRLTAFHDSRQMVDFIASGRYKFVTAYLGEWFFDEVSNSEWDFFNEVKSALKINPPHVTESIDEALDLVLQGGYIYPTQEDSNVLLHARERCGFSYMADTMPANPLHFVFHPNDTLADVWLKGMIEMQTFIAKTFEKYVLEEHFTGTKLCDEPAQAEGHHAASPLNVSDLLGLVLLYGIGIGSAFFFLASEAIKRRFFYKATPLPITPVLPIIRNH